MDDGGQKAWQTHVIKTVSQYNSKPVPAEEMKLLCEIAEDYRTVKNVVFERYSGIKSLSKLYPGYTVQNEMTGSGVRQRLGMPSVYFYLAMYDALGDIKGKWTRLKKRVLGNVNKNKGFSEDDRHYLRFAMKVDNVFGAVLNGEEVTLTGKYAKAYEEVRAKVDEGKLNNYLRRQVRKYHKVSQSKGEDGFAAAERAYRYDDHGIYITTKKKRCRVFVPLTDNNRYESQIYIKLFPREGNVEIRAPVRRKVEYHTDYESSIGIALGMRTMITTDQGHKYGTDFGVFQMEYAEWIRRQGIVHGRNADTGRKKYNARKNRYVERLHSYINHELNRLLAEERPQRIYVVKFPGPQRGGGNKAINHVVGLWQRGYIRSRLKQKCTEQSVELVEVLGSGVSRECSRCGAEGSKSEGTFWCDACGLSLDEKTNTAVNVLRRGREGKIIRN